MKQVLQTISSLSSGFRVMSRTDAAVVLHIDSAEHGGVIGPCVLEFQSPTHSWASEWMPEMNEWKDRPDFIAPVEGRIDEAHVKVVGTRLKLSFAELREPPVRWGFTATSITVQPA